jgi:ribosomal-protein-alanine N-acetyltransferase
MNPLENARLMLQPLTKEQLDLYLLNDGSLEKQLGVGYTPKAINPDLQDGIERHFLPLVAKHPVDFYFYTLWCIVLKEENVLVGDLCFKGAPDEEGHIEIGYGTYDHYQNKGIMTEAVALLLTWCQTRPELSTILAETDTGNIASEKVLLKNRFTCYHKGRDNSWWKFELRSK